jgi:hypothetical protein
MIQDCLHLDGEQAGYLGRLEVGWAVVKMQGRWFFPFLINLPLVRVDKGSITDEHIRRRLEENSEVYQEALSGVISGEEGISMPEDSQDSGIQGVPLGGKDNKMEKPGGDGCAIQLTTQDRQFLLDVWNHPTSSITQRYSSLSLSPRRGTRAQKKLLGEHLIQSCPISVGHSRIKVLSLTALGKMVLGIDEPDSDRLGGPEHRYWKKRLAEHLKSQGWEVVEEYPVGGGKAIDLLAMRDGSGIERHPVYQLRDRDSAVLQAHA